MKSIYHESAMHRSLAVNNPATRLVFALLMISGCGQGTESPSNGMPAPVPETTAQAPEPAKAATEGYYGQVKARRSLVISAEVAGLATSVPLERGDKVQPGALLLTIDQEAYALAEKQARQAVDAARIRVGQVQKAIELDEARLNAGLKQAQAAVEGAEARVRLVEGGARPEEKAQVRAAVQGARAAMQNARAELARIRKLAEANVATGQQLEAAETAAKVATAAYDKAFQNLQLVNNGAREEDKDVARAGLKQAEALLEDARAMALGLNVRRKELEAAQAAVVQAELQVEAAALKVKKTTVTATLDQGQTAVLQARNIDVGEMVAPGPPLFELLLTDRPRLVVSVPEAALHGLEVGKVFQATCDSKTQPLVATLVLIPPSADPMTLNFSLEFELDNTDQTLRMGEICQVNLKG